MNTNWTNRYYNRDEFLSWFLDEQEYVDAMFVQIVMFNFGVWVDTEDLHIDEYPASDAMSGRTY